MWRSEDMVREVAWKGPWRTSTVSAQARSALRMEYPHRADAQLMLGVAATTRVPAARVRRQRQLMRAGRWTLAFWGRILRAIIADRSVS